LGTSTYGRDSLAPVSARVAKAKSEGKYAGRQYAGRQPTARAKSADILRMAGEGKTRERIAMELEISLASVYRVLAASKAA
jgi:DNA invertase Pin-like site-specific DNA recombinase